MKSKVKARRKQRLPERVMGQQPSEEKDQHARSGPDDRHIIQQKGHRSPEDWIAHPREPHRQCHLKLVSPATVKRTVMPRRLPNADLRTREYLTEAEVERLMAAAKGNRWGHRDATMVLAAYRHGLRVSELVDLRWAQIEFSSAALHVRRVKQGTPSTHPILGDELRALRRL